MSESNYNTTKFFTEQLLAVEMRKTQVIMNKPVYLGLSILELSKTVRVRQLAYVAYICTSTFIGVRVILDMHTLTRMLVFLHDFLKFSKFFWFL